MVKLITALGRCVLASAGISAGLAAPFTFQGTNLPPDLLIGFRQTGGVQEIIVDAGPVAQFYSASPGTTVAVSGYNLGQLTNVFSSLDGLSIFAAAAVRADGEDALPLQTQWVSRRRADSETPSNPWLRQSSFSLATSASRISSIGTGAFTFSSGNAAGPNNTATAVVLPSNLSSGLTANIGSGNLKGTFQGNIESTTPVDFLETNGRLRFDLHEIRPGSGPGVYLGYFEFRVDGSLRFTAAGGVVLPPPVPVIVSLSRDGTTTAVSVQTATGFNYQLLRIDAAGSLPPVKSWIPVGNPIVATGGALTITDVATSDGAYYVVQASP